LKLKTKVLRKLKCRNCGNKDPIELYYKTNFIGEFTVETDAYGKNDDVDFGGYNLTDDFVDNMLVETGKRVQIGCDECLQ
jgi:hypothetical protein